MLVRFIKLLTAIPFFSRILSCCYSSHTSSYSLFHDPPCVPASSTNTTAYEVQAVVSQRVGKKALDILAGVLPPTIAYRIEKALPDLLYRSLMPRLTHTLTRSVTHALVPVLAESITHTDRQDYFCYACYYHHKYCNLCHYSATSAYYNSYYATYYSDYYSDCKFNVYRP